MFGKITVSMLSEVKSNKYFLQKMSSIDSPLRYYYWRA